MALAENIEREDLTPIEEAWGFAEGVTVEVDGEEMSYAEYVENLRENTCVPGNNSVILPSQKDRDVETEAEATGTRQRRRCVSGRTALRSRRGSR